MSRRTEFLLYEGLAIVFGWRITEIVMEKPIGAVALKGIKPGSRGLA